MSISEIEERIRDRVEVMCDAAPPSDATPEAWATWKRRCVFEVADIVANEREACAYVAEDFEVPSQAFGSRSYEGIGGVIADAIRKGKS